MTNYRRDIGAIHDRIVARERRRSDEAAQLRQECSWCGVTIRDGREPTSHGCCPRCAKKYFGPDAA